MKKARYIGGGVFRYGDRKIEQGDTIDGPPALVDALIERPDFEAEGSGPAKKKKAKNEKKDDPILEVEIDTEDN